MEETGLIFFGIIGLLLILLITISILIIYSGVFYSVVVRAGPPPFGEIVIAYKFTRGSYKGAGPLFTEVATIAPDNKAVGIYYDNPKWDSDNLRYIVGSVLSDKKSENCEVDEKLKRKFLDNNFKLHTLPEVTNVVKTSFPYISLLSIFIALYKVYPRIGEYIEEHKLCARPIVEMYDGQTIHFFAPLAQQDHFYVPECLSEENKDLETTLDESTIRDTTFTTDDQTFDSSSLSVELSVTPIKITVGDHGAKEGDSVSKSEIAEETKPEETKPEETKPEETKPEETNPEETKPEETNPEEGVETISQVISLELTSSAAKENESGSEASTSSSFEDIKMESEEFKEDESKKEK